MVSPALETLLYVLFLFYGLIIISLMGLYFWNRISRADLMTEFSRFLDSRNNELRMVSLLVWLNQDPPEMLDRLAGYPHELSDRDCANIYALAQRRYIPVAEAEKLIHSPNPSVVRFGRRVLKLNGF